MELFPSPLSRTARTSMGGFRPSASARFHLLVRAIPTQGYEYVSGALLFSPGDWATLKSAW